VPTVYYQRVGDIAAFILAGGKSTRMGTDKAFLEIGGRTLLSHAMGIAAAVAPEVVIVGDGSKFSAFGRVVEDVYREQGPLAGIHAALLSSCSALNFMLAVDMPYVEANFVEYLISEAGRTRAVVTVPRLDRGWQPLCAVYRRNFAATAQQALRNRKNKIDALFSQVKTRTISQQDMVRLNFSDSMFHNLNSPADLSAPADVAKLVSKVIAKV
jgi:molybdopterin-guanine dinucleotide biosynthesis protein A